jgi:hypothetical protein
MLIISHRGNLGNSSPEMENKPEQVANALYEGFDVEIDVWLDKDGFYLGHDSPQYKVEFSFLRKTGLWIHCKHVEAMAVLSSFSEINAFMHTDGIIITPNRFLWTAPGLQLTSVSIAVMPETVPDWDISKAFGVCTDFPLKYK